MNLESVRQAVIAYCQANANRANVAKYAKYFTEGYDAYGLDTKSYERGVVEIYQLFKDQMTLDDAFALGDLLFASGKYEEASFAIGLLMRFKRQFSPEHLPRVKAWMDHGVRNWAHSDVICSEILNAFYLQALISYEDLEPWIVSASKWTRRAVPVALIKFLKSVEVTPLIIFVEPLINDGEKVVHQGMGWFLREAWKREPEMVEDFLLKIKDDAPRLIIQYATEKMSKEEKERFKKGNKKNS